MTHKLTQDFTSVVLSVSLFVFLAVGMMNNLFFFTLWKPNLGLNAIRIAILIDLVVGHSNRVADLAVEIGKKLGLDSEKLRELKIAGLIHDVGMCPLQELR